MINLQEDHDHNWKQLSACENADNNYVTISYSAVQDANLAHWQG